MQIFAVLGDVQFVALNACPVTRGGPLHFADQAGSAPHRVERQLVAIQVVEHHHIEWRGGGAFFLEAAHMDIGVVVAAVGEFVNQRRVAMKGEEDRAVGGEQGVEVAVVQAVRVFRG